MQNALELQAQFNRNDINKLVGDVRKQIHEVEEVLQKLSSNGHGDHSQCEKGICDKEVPTAIEDMIDHLQLMVDHRDDLLSQVQSRYDDSANRLKELTNRITSYVKPKSKAVASK